LVDSPENLQQLIAGAQRANIGRPLQILIEVGCDSGRCGVRSFQQGMTLAEAAHNARPWMNLVGVECFEGVVQLTDAGLATVDRMLDLVMKLAAAGAARGFFGDRVLLSAGGSGFFDLVAQNFPITKSAVPVETVIRSGCYLTHDHGMYHRLFAAAKQRSASLQSIGYDLQPALQVWGQILSLPEPGRIICGVGKRDVGSDAEMPKVVGWARSGDAAPRPMPAGFAVKALNDQHAFIEAPAESVFQVGDMLAFGVSHPCTTFDRWRALLLVDERYRLTGFVKTYF
jgi:D-serine dehydratase